MRKVLVLILILTFVTEAKSQIEINNYKYVVIPLQYEFLENKDSYRLNTLTRVLFKQEGFSTYFTEEELPQDLSEDKCLALYPDVIKVGGGPFKKKVQIIIKDCYGKTILESDIGDSSENNHQKAYNEALRKAFKSIEKLNYSYQPKVSSDNSETEINTTIEEVSTTINNINEEEEGVANIPKTKTETEDKSIDIKNPKQVIQEDLHQERYPLLQIAQSQTPVVYSAKKVDKGYDIYSTTLKTYKFTMYATILNGVFIFQNDEVSGNIVKRENGSWVMEYLKEGKYTIEPIKLNFQ